MLVTGVIVADIHTHVENVVRLLVEHGLGAGRRKAGILKRINPARLAELLDDHHLIAQGHEVVGDGERRGAGADEGDALAILFGEAPWGGGR